MQTALRLSPRWSNRANLMQDHGPAGELHQPFRHAERQWSSGGCQSLWQQWGLHGCSSPTPNPVPHPMKNAASPGNSEILGPDLIQKLRPQNIQLAVRELAHYLWYTICSHEMKPAIIALAWSSKPQTISCRGATKVETKNQLFVQR